MVQKLEAYIYEGGKLVAIHDCTLMPYHDIGEFMYLQDLIGRQVEWQRSWEDGKEKENQG